MVRDGVRDDVQANEIGKRSKVGVVPESRHHNSDADAGHDDTKAGGFKVFNYVIRSMSVEGAYHQA